MDINELQSYRLSDAVKFNERLNPKLWGRDEKLLPEVRQKLLAIAEDFKEFLGIDLEVKDITISGSNAAYTYTPHSDIDLHLVADLPRGDSDEVYRELFDAKKYQYNDEHDYKIGGYDVELYVQNANKPHHSQGIYSVLNNDWVKVPSRKKPTVDDISVRSKYEDIAKRIDAAIESGDLARMDTMSKKIRDMRQAGLDQHGEFSPENLAFKVLRGNGTLQRLRDTKLAAKDQEMSLEEKARVTYGFKNEVTDEDYHPNEEPPGPESKPEMPAGTVLVNVSDVYDWYKLGQDISDLEHANPAAYGKGAPQTILSFGSEPVEHMYKKNLDRLGLKTLDIDRNAKIRDPEEVYRMDEDRDMSSVLKSFVDFVVNKLGIEQSPRIRIKRDPAWSERNNTFGRYVPEEDTLYVSVANRHVLDVLRTIAHELTHHRQQEVSPMPPESGETGSPWEDEANALAGRIMRDFGEQNPNLFRADDVDESLGTKLAALGTAACIAGTPGCATNPTVRDVAQGVQTVGRTAQTLKGMKADDAREELTTALKDYLRRGTGTRENRVMEATGYVPVNDREARDPRYVMAITQDIKPGEIQRQARKMGFRTDAAGNPPLIRQELARKLRLIKEDLRPGQVVDLTKNFQNYSRVHARVDDVMPNGKIRLTVIDADALNGKRVLDIGRQILVAPNYVRNAPVITEDRIKVDEFLSNQVGGNGDGDNDDPQERLLSLAKSLQQAMYGPGRNKADTQRIKHEIEQLGGILKPTQSDEGYDVALFHPQHWRGGILITPAGVGMSAGPLNENEDLFEVKMSPGELEKWARSPEAEGIQAGFEAELIFRDTGQESEEEEYEPDWDMDERCENIDQVVEFFQGGDNGVSSRTANRIRDGLYDEFADWREEAIADEWSNVEEDQVRDYMETNVWGDDSIQDQYREQAAEELGIDTSEESADQAEAIEQRAREIFEAEVKKEIQEEGRYYDEAREYYRDMMADGDEFDESAFFDDKYHYMSDVGNAYDVDWPYYHGGGDDWEGGSRSVDDIASSLSRALDQAGLDGSQVKGSSGYHSTTRKPGRWIIEPDGSLDPDDRSEESGLEVVSPPMPLPQALKALRTVIDWANGEGDAYTNSSTGLHMGVSIPYKGGDVDYVKLILFMGDQHVLQEFGRTANSYCRSALEKLETVQRQRRSSMTEADIKSLKGAEKTVAAMDLMRKNLIELAARYVQDGVGESKYTSAHIKPGYIEFRSPGGDYLSMDDRDETALQNTMLRFARAMQIAGRPDVERKEYAKKLYKLIDAQGDEALKLFLDYSTGKINQEELKKNWARQVLAKERPPVDPGMKEYEVFIDHGGQAEIIDTVQARDDNDAYSQYRDRYRDDPRWWKMDIRKKGNEYEVVNDRGEVIDTINSTDLPSAQDQALQKYSGQGFGFSVREKQDAKPEKKLSRRAEIARKIAGRPTVWHVEDTNTGKVLLIAAQNTTDAKYMAMRRDPAFEKLSREDPDSFLVQPATAAERAQYQEQQKDNKQDSQDLEQTLQPGAASNRMRYNVSWIEIRNGAELQDSLNVDAATAEAAERQVTSALEASGRTVKSGSIEVTPLGQNGGRSRQQEYQIYNPDTGMPVVAFMAADDRAAYERIEQYRQQHPAIPVALRNAPVPGSTQDRAQQRAHRAGVDRETMEIYNPRTGEVITTAYNATVQEIMARIQEIEQERGLGAGLLRVRYPGEGGQQQSSREFTGRWQVRNARTGEVVYTFGGVGNNQADANQQAARWVRQTRYDDPVEVVPEMGIYGSGN